ncbi:MAG: molybdopterin cofactor-binding domain-containing protein [Candidatus Cloacimonadales bacterium]
MKSVKKFDAVPKLNGTWRYLDDYQYAGMIHGQFLLSDFHHGIIKDIIFPEGYNLDEFTFARVEDIPGTNIVPEPVNDQPFMVDDEIMHKGQVIMGIAHPDKRLLNEFVKNTKIIYDELPAVVGVKQCLDDENNHFGKADIIDHRTDTPLDPTWKKHHHVYYMPHQEQAYLEPQGTIAIYKPEKKELYIRVTAQCPFYVKSGIENIMGATIDNAVVESTEGLGGAFGGKEDFPTLLSGVAALLAYKSGKPVKIVLERNEDIAITTKRHPARVEITTYTDPESKKIKKLNIDYRLDAGAYQTCSTVVMSRGILHACGGYSVPDTYIIGRLFRSNTPINGAFRGFGAPQAFAAIEAHIDRIAHDLEIDPYKFRKVNVFREGDEFPTTQPILENHLEHCLDRVVEKSDYQRKVKEYREWNRTHKDKKGIGISIGFHGGGFTGNGEKLMKPKIKVTIDKEAIVRIYVSSTDMGQGAHTTLAQMFFEAIDHPREKCWVELPNTDKTPDSGPTAASRTIYIIGNLLANTAKEIKRELGFDNLEAYVKEHQDEFPKEYFKIFVPPPSVVFDAEKYVGIAYKDYSWAATVNEIIWHADTYQIELIKSWNVLDVGKVVNEKIAVGQAEGGILQGLAYGTTEYMFKPGFGRMNGFTDYTLPTTLDIPQIDVEFIHTDSLIAKGLGEVPMDYPAPAIRNAFHFASSLFIDEYPLIPERIFAAMQKK